MILQAKKVFREKKEEKNAFVKPIGYILCYVQISESKIKINRQQIFNKIHSKVLVNIFNLTAFSNNSDFGDLNPITKSKTVRLL